MCADIRAPDLGVQHVACRYEGARFIALDVDVEQVDSIEILKHGSNAHSTHALYCSTASLARRGGACGAIEILAALVSSDFLGARDPLTVPVFRLADVEPDIAVSVCNSSFDEHGSPKVDVVVDEMLLHPTEVRWLGFHTHNVVREPAVRP